MIRERSVAYGPPQINFARIAKVWSGLLGIPISMEKVALLLAAFKICRGWNDLSQDTVTDGSNYLALAQYCREYLRMQDASTGGTVGDAGAAGEDNSDKPAGDSRE